MANPEPESNAPEAARLDFAPAVEGLQPGQREFGRYRLIRFLGRGGMGVVWLAHDELLDLDVALKFLPEILSADPDANHELKRETKRALHLTHPNIIRVHDFISNNQKTAIVMEYINGKSLAQLKSEQPERFFEVDQIRPWIVQICEALDYAHQQVQIVHRDLKPANLMVDDKGVVKLMDFGISRSLVDSVSRLTNSTSGTLCYMSPQQATGKPPSPTDDLYALGATIYELLTGKPPFYTGHILMQLMNCIKMCPV